MKDLPQFWEPIPMSNRRFHDFGPQTSWHSLEHAATSEFPPRQKDNLYEVSVKTTSGSVRLYDLILCRFSVEGFRETPRPMGLLQVEEIEEDADFFGTSGDIVEFKCLAKEFWATLSDFQEKGWWTDTILKMASAIAGRRPQSKEPCFRGVPGSTNRIGICVETGVHIHLWNPNPEYNIECLFPTWPKTVFAGDTGTGGFKGEWFKTDQEAVQWAKANFEFETGSMQGIPLRLGNRKVTPARTKTRICRCGAHIVMGLDESKFQCEDCEKGITSP